MVETILSTALTNIVFGFFSTQPLMLVGPTGPVLVFEKHLYSVSNRMEGWLAILRHFQEYFNHIRMMGG